MRTNIRGDSDPLLSEPGLYRISPTSTLILRQEVEVRDCSPCRRGTQGTLGSFDCPCPDSEQCLLLSPHRPACRNLGCPHCSWFSGPSISSELLSSHLKKKNLCSLRFLLPSLAVLHPKPITFWLQIANQRSRKSVVLSYSFGVPLYLFCPLSG